jgi:glycerol-3-phosphate dehydrogenase
MKGAILLNYCEVMSLLKDPQGRVSGAIVLNKLTGKTHKVRAKYVVNCAGPPSDEIRKPYDPQARPRITASRGSHILLKDDFTKEKDTAILISKTTGSGKMLFVTNFQGKTLVGSTEEQTDASHSAEATAKDVQKLVSDFN